MIDVDIIKKTWFMGENTKLYVRKRIIDNGYGDNPKICPYCNKHITGHTTVINYSRVTCCSRICSSNYNKSKSLTTRLSNKQRLIDDANILPLNELIDLLKSVEYNYTNYFGKGSVKQLIHDNVDIYKSILYYTNPFEHMYKGSKMNLTCRLLLIVEYELDISTITCKCGVKILFNPETQRMNDTIYCRKCKPSANSKEYYKFKYGDDWENHWKELREFRSTLMLNTSFHPMVSKISLKLFDSLSELTSGIPQYGDNNEYRFNLSIDDRNQLFEETGIDRMSFYIDFKLGDKIIEFNGEYWHSKTQCYDDERKRILEDNGYSVLFVNERNYIENSNKVINTCMEFLNDTTHKK